MAIGNERTSRRNVVSPFFVGLFCLALFNGLQAAAGNDLYHELCRAVLNNNPVEIRRLVGTGVNINSVDTDGFTPLHWATIGAKGKAVECLVSMGADLSLRTTRDFVKPGKKPYPAGSTVLDFAQIRGEQSIISYLSQVKKQRSSRSAAARRTRAAAINDLGSQLRKAACYGNLATVKRLVSEGAHVDARGNNGETPLYLAAQEGKLDVVQWLVGRGADIHAVRDTGATPLHVAAWGGKLAVVRWLVGQGADVHSAANNGWTPLLYAAKGGSLEVMQWLVGRGVDIRTPTNDGGTSLHLAAESGHLAVVRWLADKTGDIDAAMDDNRTPLFAAAWGGKLDVVRWLASKGADICAAMNNGATPLYAAAQEGNMDVVQWLVGRGADIRAARDSGETSLYAAAWRGNLDVVQWLVANGADMCAARDTGWTPLHAAAWGGKLDVVQWLTSKGADTSIRSTKEWIGDGKTYPAGSRAIDCARIAGKRDVVTYLQSVEKQRSSRSLATLHKASTNGNLAEVKRLISQGARVNAVDKNGSSALHMAAYAGHGRVVEYLVEQGARVNAVNKYGNTALHSAAVSGRKEVVEYLVGHGADVLIKTKKKCAFGGKTYALGSTALDCARIAGNNEIVSCLKSAHEARFDRSDNKPNTGANALKYTISPSERDRRLGVAARAGNLSEVMKWVEQGANVNTEGLLGTALNQAGSNGYLDVVHYLLEKGAEVKPGDRLGLHAATLHGDPSMVKWLVGQGADMSIRTTRAYVSGDHTIPVGSTALDCARVAGNKEILAYFELVQKQRSQSVTISSVQPAATAISAAQAKKLPESERNPLDTTSLHAKGLAYYDQGLYEKAIKSFEHALQGEKDHHPSLTYRIQATYALGRFNDVIKKATHLLKIYPTYSWAFLMRAQAYIFMGKTRKASDDLRQAVAHAERGDVYATIAAALLDAIAKRGRQAYEKLTHALEILPEDPFIYLHGGKIALDGKQYKTAVADFKKVLELLPHCVPAHKGLEMALSGLSRQKPSGNQAAHSREVNELRDYVERMRQEMLSLHAQSEHKFEESLEHQSEEMARLTELFSSSVQWQHQVEISDENIDEIIRRIVQTENLAGWRHQIALLDHQIEVLAEEQVEQKVALIQQKKALVKLVSKAEEEEQIDEEQKYILADAKLRDFYLTMRIQLSSTYVGAQAVLSGFAQADTSSKTSDVLDVIGDSIPFSAVLVKLFGKLASYPAVRRQRKAINSIMRLAPDSTRFNDVCETVARKLTFAKESEIQQIAPKAQPRGWFKKTLYKLKKKYKKVKQKLTVSSLDNLIKEEAAKIAEEILQQVMDGEIDDQLDVVEEMVDIIVAGGYQLLAPVQPGPLVDEGDEDELMEQERRRLVTKRGVAGRRVPAGAQVTIAHRLDADRVKQQVARGEQITQRQQDEINELKREKEEQARKMAEMERKMELMMAMMEQGVSPAGNALFIPNMKKRLLTGVITQKMLHAPTLDVSRLQDKVSTEFVDLLKAATDEYDLVITDDPEMDAVAKSITVERNGSMRSLIFIDDQFFMYLLSHDAAGDPSAVAALHYLYEHEKVHLMHEHSGLREDVLSEEIEATVKGMLGLNDVQVQQATAFLHGWLERVEQFYQRQPSHQRMYSVDDMQLFKHLLLEMSNGYETQRLHNTLKAITDAVVGKDSGHELYFADCGT